MTSDEYQEEQAGGPPCECCGEHDCICEREREKNRRIYEAAARELGHTAGPAEVFAEGALWLEDLMRSTLRVDVPADVVLHPLEHAASDFEEERDHLQQENLQLATDLHSAHTRIARLEDLMTALQAQLELRHVAIAQAEAPRPQLETERCDNVLCQRELPRDSSGRSFVCWDARRGLKFCSLGCCVVHAEDNP